MVCAISLDYKAYVTRDNRRVKQFLIRYQNSLYGTMVTSLLYYHKFTKIMKSIGFEINLYDMCISNKMIYGSHIKILFHIYDCNLIHRERKENDCIIKWICQEYESIFEDGSAKMSLSRGKVNEYLRMTLNYTVCGQVRINMFSYTKEILTNFDKTDPKGKVMKSSAAPNNIFVVNKGFKKLDKEKVIELHNLVENTLYDTKRTRSDICTAITFLGMIVRATDKEDWAKLVHLMQCIRVTNNT